MKISVFLLAACWGCLVAAVPASAQRAASPTPNAAYPDSPARANPRAGAGKPTASTDDGKRGPRGPLDWERTLALSPDGRLFVTANLDGRMRVWDSISGKSEVELPVGVADVVFSPDGRLLACRLVKEGTTDDRPWQVFRAADGKPAGEPLSTSDTDGHTADQIVFSPDGKLLAGSVGVGLYNRFVLWDAVSGKSLAAQTGYARTLAFAPDGKTLAVGGTGPDAKLFGVPDLKPLQTFALDPHQVTDVAAFSPDGKLLAVGGDIPHLVKGQQDRYPTASLYEVATGKLVAELKVTPHAGARVRQIVFANGGRVVVTATDGAVQAWSCADGRLQANLPGGTFPLAVSPDGKMMAGSQHPDLVCWDTVTWRLGLKIANAKAGYGTGTGQLGFVPLVFVPDGSGIVTLRGNSIAAWELPGGRPVIELEATQMRMAR